MKFIIASRDNGLSKAYKVDDEHRWGNVVDLKIGNEIDGEKILGEAYKGYILRVAGGTDQDGFPMKNGVLKKGRTRLLIPPRTCGLRSGREGERKRRSVRGCIVDRDIGTLHLTIVSKGEKEIEGLTDKKTPRRLGPKRANKIRKLFGLPKHSDKIGSKDKTKVHVDRFDVCRYVVRRPTKTVGDKHYTKAPKIQRLITARRLKRKRDHRKEKFAAVTANQEVYKKYIEKLRANAAERKKRQEEATAQTAAATQAQTAATKTTTAGKATTATAGKGAATTATQAKGAATTATAGKGAATTAAQAKGTTAAQTKGTTAPAAQTKGAATAPTQATQGKGTTGAQTQAKGTAAAPKKK